MNLPMTCPNCNSQLDGSSNFCPNCGASLSPNVTSSNTPPGGGDGNQKLILGGVIGLLVIAVVALAIVAIGSNKSQLPDLAEATSEKTSDAETIAKQDECAKETARIMSTAMETAYADQENYKAGFPELTAIEPDIVETGACGEGTAARIGSTVNNESYCTGNNTGTEDSYCVSQSSASGTWFAIIKNSSDGTYARRICGTAPDYGEETDTEGGRGIGGCPETGEW